MQTQSAKDHPVTIQYINDCMADFYDDNHYGPTLAAMRFKLREELEEFNANTRLYHRRILPD